MRAVADGLADEPVLLPGSPATRPLWRMIARSPDRSAAFVKAANRTKKQDAADFLQEAAENFGVIDDIGQDAVQSIVGKIGEATSPAKQNGATTPEPTAPTPYRFRDPAKIPRRAWLYGRHYIRRFVTSTVAAGGIGKTSLALAEAIAIVMSLEFLGAKPESEGLRVWYWNGEDPLEEIERRIAAICQHHNIDMHELEASGRLFFDSGHDTPIKLASPGAAGKVIFNEKLIAWLKKRITENRIHVVVLDPFISCHGISENDNSAIDQVVKRLAQIAVECDCSIEIAHHVRKAVRGQAELTTDDARGGSAIVNACRSARVLNRMKPIEAEAAGVKGEKAHRLYVRIDRDKANMAPAEAARWVHLVDVALANGDHVGAVEAWQYPKPFDGVTVADMRAVRDAARRANDAGNPYMLGTNAKERWIGAAVAERLELDVTNVGHCKRISSLVKTWIQTGVLKIEERLNQHRNKRKFIAPGDWNEPPSAALEDD